MGFRNDFFAGFFFERFSIDNSWNHFLLANLLVFVHMLVYTFLTQKYKKNLLAKVTGPFFMFFNMFIIMCYNRWVILCYLIGETSGYFIYRVTKIQ